MTFVRRLICAAWLCISIFLLGARLKVSRFEGVFPESYRLRGFPSDISARNLLNVERDKPFGLPKAPAQTRTLRICAIRVEFQPDTTRLTTGDGTFDLSPRERSSYPIDPTPHDSIYFMAHLEALARYWYMVSDGKLILEYDLYPRTRFGAYRLNNQMSYYSLDSWFGDYKEALQALFVDGFELAYKTDSIPYERYDVFVLFHAGADLQGDIGQYYEWLDPTIYIPSPHDIPTAFITLDCPPIRGIIQEGLIIPEYVSQDGQLGALNGVFAHEFGHQLGLVDLYHSGNFITQVGDFSLMDNGGTIWVQIPDYGYVRSVLPSYPSAWERAYLGWETPLVVPDSARHILLECTEIFDNQGTTIVKIPINQFEYFLIENRQANFGPDTSIYLHQDSISGVIMGPIYEDGTYCSKYDYLLPGSGILIWHVDELVAYGDTIGNGKNNFENNTLQWNPYRRFIDLEEADGVQDLGFIMTYGEPDDYFFAENNNRFSSTTNPNSNSASGAKTYIAIENISSSSCVMSFDISREYGFGMWIRYAPGTNFSPVVIGRISESEPRRVIFISADDRIYGYYGNGDGIFGFNDTVGIIDYKSDTLFVPVSVFARSYRGEIFSAPTVFDIDGDSFYEVLVCGYDGGFYVFSTRFAYGYAELVYSARFEASFILPPLILSEAGAAKIFLGGRDGRFFVLNSAMEVEFSGDVGGEIRGAQVVGGSLYILAERAKGMLFRFEGGSGLPSWSRLLDGGNFAPLMKGDWNGDSTEDILAFSRDGYIYAFDGVQGKVLSGFPIVFETHGQRVSLPACGDILGNGRLSIAFVVGDSLFVYANEGVREMNFPVRLPFYGVGAPVIVDITGEGGDEILLPSVDGGIYAYDYKGRILPGFPIVSGVVISLAVGDLDNDNVAEIVGYGADNAIYCYRLGELYPFVKDVGWTMWGADAHHSFAFFTPYEKRVGDGVQIVSNFFNYPNPARDLTYFRVNLKKRAEIMISVYDIEGRKIFEAGKQDANEGYFELAYDTSHLSTGIYFARLEAKSLTGQKEVKFIKVAITKDER